MFHVQHQSREGEPCGTTTARRGHLPRLLWVIALICSMALACGVVRFPEFRP